MGTWELVESIIIREAALDDLLKYISKKWGENEADRIAGEFQKMPFDELRNLPKLITQRYVDDKATKLAQGVVNQLSGWDPDEKTTEDEPYQDQPATLEPPKSIPPWQKPVGNKIKGLPGSLPTAKPSAAPPAEPEPEEEPEMPRDFVPGATRGPRPTGFADPTQVKGTKDQTTAVAGPVPKAKAGASGVKDLQKRLWHFAQKYGPQPGDTPEQIQQKQGLIQRMSQKYGVPVPETDDEGKPIYKNADQMANRDPSSSTTRAAASNLRQSNKPAFDGTYVGQSTQMRGVGQPARAWYANQATGQMQRRNYETNPASEGPSWVWAGKQYGWVTPSNFASLVAAKKVTPERGKSGTYNPDDVLPRWLQPGGTGSSSKKRTKLD